MKNIKYKEFPSSFLWGAAISSYQCEGGNDNADWFFWEKEKNLTPAGLSCNHYRFFDNDFRLAHSLNLNSMRISIEWSRLAPREGIYDEQQIQHYREVIDSLLLYKLKPLVTLHHFTNPQWFVQAGGWAVSKNIDYFIEYVKKIVTALRDKVDFWLIFNEPLVYIYNGFVCGTWPPGRCSWLEAMKALDNITQAYVVAYDEIKRLYAGRETIPQISFTKHMRVFSPCRGPLKSLHTLSSFYRSRLFNYQLLDKLAGRSKIDFLALNYYCKEYVRFKGFLGRACSCTTHNERKNYLGWYVDPEGFYKVLMSLKKYKLPVYVTENGTSEQQSYLYTDYLRSHIKSLYRAYAGGLDLKGYFWWSLLDNFEWDKGFGPRFGLNEVNYNNFKRIKKQFALIYSDICHKGLAAVDDTRDEF